MANYISKIRQLLEDKKEDDEEEKKEKVEEAADEEEELKKELEKEAAGEEDSEEEKDEEEVEEAACDMDDDIPLEKEAADEEPDGDEEAPVEDEEPVEESEEEEAPVEDEEPAEEDDELEEADELEKEFDVNDDSDVFLDDEEEEAASQKDEAHAEPDGDEAPVEDEEEVEEAACDLDSEDEEEVKEEKGDEEDEEEKVEEEKEEDEPKKPVLDVEEHLQAMFKGEKLSESFKSKIKTIFESAVRTKTIEYSRNLKGRYNAKLRAAKASIQESLINKLDGYFDYIVEEWMGQNKLAVEHGLRTEITEEFVSDLRSLFEQHNIDIPKGKENLVDSLANKVAKVQKELNEEIKKNISLKRKLNEQKKNEILRELCEGLADTEIEKLKSLASNLEYSNEYREKLNVLKESYFHKTVKKEAASVQQLKETNNKSEDKTEAKAAVDPDMRSITSVLSKLR